VKEFSKICIILLITLLASLKLSAFSHVWNSNDQTHYSKKSEKSPLPIVFSQVAESETNDSSEDDDDKNDEDAKLVSDQNQNTANSFPSYHKELNFSLSRQENYFFYLLYLRFRSLRI
jgi:hypothetical protein